MTSPCLSPQLPSSPGWKLLEMSSSPGFFFYSGTQTRRRSRRRCTFSKYFTKTGIFLVLGVIILVALPHWAFCRPLDQASAEDEQISKRFQIYQDSPGGSSHLLTSSSRSGSSTNAGSPANRFEFRRKIHTSSSKEPDADNVNKNSNIYENSNVKSSEDVANNSNYKPEDNVLLGGNSSMIVQVIVSSSSSSTSSGSVEYDETDSSSKQDSPEETVQYTVSDDNEHDGVLIAEPSSESHVSTVQSAPTLETQKSLNSNQEDNTNFPKASAYSQTFQNGPEQLDLKKLPKSENETADIFSAFYRAFSETSLPPEIQFPSTSSSPAQKQKPAAASKSTPKPTTDATITTAFRIPPGRSDFRQRPSSFQLFQQRRRLFRNRQLLERKTSTTLPPPTFSKNITNGSSFLEETARQLEYLAKKLDISEQAESFGGQQDKILAVSSSSSSSLITTTTTQVPFLSSQPSSPLPLSFSPSKIAVSVTHSKSVVASSPLSAEWSEEQQPTKQEAVVIRGETKSNAKSETTFSTSSPEVRDGQIYSTYSYFTRPRPLIKSLPRNKDGDQRQYDNINNKNRGNNHIFPKNFSTHGKERENGILRKIYGSDGEEGNIAAVNGNGKSETSGDTNSHHKDKSNEKNFRIQDRHGILSLSTDGGFSTLPSNSPKSLVFSISGDDASSFFETSTFRPQKRKITRTVSSELGNPSSFYFNVNVNYGSTTRSPSKAPVLIKANHSQQQQQSTPKPVTNWQQPEKVWSEPAQIWGVPAKVWGEPERVWGEPAQIWGQSEKIWEKKLEDEMMQSDQPSEDRNAGGKPEEEEMPKGTFVVLGDDENEGDSIDGDLGRPLMLHHFTVPQKSQKETVSVSSSVSSSISKNIQSSSSSQGSGPFSRNVPTSQQPTHQNQHGVRQVSAETTSASSSALNSNSDSSSGSEKTDTDQQSQNKKSGKKFGYVIEGANVRKYRVEERTPDGFIVGEYGVLNNQNAFLRGVRYTADGTINPRLIHEALMKFLSLRR